MPRLEPGLVLGFPAAESSHAAAAAAAPATTKPLTERRHPPTTRRRRPPATRRRKSTAAAASDGPPVGPVTAHPDPGRPQAHFHSHPFPTPPPRREPEVVVESLEDQETEEPLPHSFSQSLIECQKRRYRSEALALGQRSRPASVDLNVAPGVVDLAVLSPRYLVGNLGGMSKSSTASSRSRSGTFPSPGTPNYHRHCAPAVSYPKGWSSERVPLSASSNRRCGGSGVVLPFNNGRKLPSKWEDAEKWILSPVSGDGIGRLSAPPPHHRRPKSKSGPLGHPGGVPGAYAAVSPLVPCFDGVLAAANFAANSPFSAGVLMAEHGRNGDFSNGRGRSGDDGSSRSYSAEKEPYIFRSASIHLWTDTLMEASSSTRISEETVQDDKIQTAREAAPMISCATLKKDVATQMSPEGSTPSSPKGRPSCSNVLSHNPIKELNNHISKLEVRDVQVDDQVTVTRWSKQHVTRGSDKRSTNIIEWRKKTAETRAPSFDEKERERCISKSKREEAKITAWENLQKAKAEAAIRKLEMKLEKKRSSSMDKILNKLRSAQKRAQDMRTTVSANGDRCGVTTTKKASYFGRTGKSFSRCFTCHAF